MDMSLVGPKNFSFSIFHFPFSIYLPFTNDQIRSVKLLRIENCELKIGAAGGGD